jgi:catechol 2,3-dioxygenase-like lactoylglutathione lyase family enzyme
MAWSLELVTVPVADVERAMEFYVEQVGFRVVQDTPVSDGLRFVELRPLGSCCSIAIGVGLTEKAPGSIDGLQMVVHDIEAAWGHLSDRGVDVTPVTDYPWGRFVFFKDPDGNGWSVIEPPGIRGEGQA